MEFDRFQVIGWRKPRCAVFVVASELHFLSFQFHPLPDIEICNLFVAAIACWQVPCVLSVISTASSWFTAFVHGFPSQQWKTWVSSRWRRKRWGTSLTCTAALHSHKHSSFPSPLRIRSSLCRKKITSVQPSSGSVTNLFVFALRVQTPALYTNLLSISTDQWCQIISEVLVSEEGLAIYLGNLGGKKCLVS